MAGSLAGQAAPTSAPLVLIFDASGSMWGQIEGENKVVIARRAVGELITALPADSQAALVAYGHRREGDCTDIETLVPLGPLDKPGFQATVEALQPKGKTPITDAVEAALDIVRAGGEETTVILLSDGLETCGGDPCRAVRLAKDAGVTLVMHVVGFDVADEDVSQLQCMAQAGGGLFLGADDAAELGAALEAAIALPANVPVGRLVVHATADDQLVDASIRVADAAGQEVAVARTYDQPDTNPRAIPLADGTYSAAVRAVGLKGDNERVLEFSIVDGGTVEKTADFSAGELKIGVTRNGELSDVSFRVYAAGTNREVAAGRTYKTANSNPATVKLTAGRYEVRARLLDLSTSNTVDLGTVVVEPRGRHTVEHEFASGSVSLGATLGGERLDALVSVLDADTGKTLAKGRTYTSAKTNPKHFVLVPGRYRVLAKTLGKPKRQQEAEIVIEAGVDQVRDFDFEPTADGNSGG